MTRHSSFTLPVRSLHQVPYNTINNFFLPKVRPLFPNRSHGHTVVFSNLRLFLVCDDHRAHFSGCVPIQDFILHSRAIGFGEIDLCGVVMGCHSMPMFHGMGVLQINLVVCNILVPEIGEARLM